MNFVIFENFCPFVLFQNILNYGNLISFIKYLKMLPNFGNLVYFQNVSNFVLIWKMSSI